MNKPRIVLKFDSPLDHYDADACVIWCFDDRFSALLDKFQEGQGYKHCDVVKIAGGIQSFAADSAPEVEEFLLGQVRKSRELHRTPKVVLMVHRDCGGYGGSKSFGMDKAAEYSELKSDLEKTEAFLRANLGDSVLIEKYIADFDGLYKV